MLSPSVTRPHSNIYSQKNIKKCLPYLLLTNTDRATFQFVLVCELNCAISESSTRQIFFEIILRSKIRDRLDVADDFYTLFGIQNKSLKKQTGLY